MKGNTRSLRLWFILILLNAPDSGYVLKPQSSRLIAIPPIFLRRCAAGEGAQTTREQIRIVDQVKSPGISPKPLSSKRTLLKPKPLHNLSHIPKARSIHGFNLRIS